MQAPAKNSACFLVEVEGVQDPLHVVRFDLVESISGLFELNADLACPNRDLDLATMLRKPALLTILGVHEGDTPRWVHGIVHGASQGRQDDRFGLYHVRVVPRVWPLLHRQDCRIFQDMSTSQIVEDVLKGAGVPKSGVRFALAQPSPVRGYCVQYRETDWDFVRRLLAEDGLYHCFEHSAEGHVLVIGDGTAAYGTIGGNAVVQFNDVESAADRDVVRRFRYTQQLTPGKFTVRDFNFATPDDTLEGQATAGAGDLEVYEFPGRYDEPALARRAAKLRLQAFQALQHRGEGESNCPRLLPGHIFELSSSSGALRDDVQRKYLLLSVRHHGEQPQALALSGTGLDSSYSNSFECIPADVPYRPAEWPLRPEMRGVQTAIVVGPGGEEVHTDEHGRVKVQFHWDRMGKRDENSSCWVRVSQMWAGQGWGAMWIPRIGHEVIVDFIEGDADRPIITGRVYHGNNQPPYPLPDKKTASTIKSDSSPGGGGSNELRFEDQKGSEEVFLHAQKDWTIAVENDKNQTVGHDETLSVGNDRKKSVVNNQSESIGVDKSVTVGSNHSEQIGVNMSIAVGANLDEQVGANATFTIGGNRSEMVTVASAETVGAAKALTIGAAYQVSVGGVMNETVGLAKAEEVGLAKMVVVGADSSLNVGGSHSVRAGANVSASAGANIIISAAQNMNLTSNKDLRVSVGKQAGVLVADKLTIEVGTAKVTISKNGDIAVNGKKLSIKASGEVVIKGSKVKLN
ncbi:MAG: type VI secretion system tip protein VgrG [Nannocystis sp.]|nr:type VI secretion system tip protein TssI/VgrG [Nannocystis sp.]MBA3548091.1 type VI secretion system tip protein VgrG [Nannocystis sp.]